MVHDTKFLLISLVWHGYSQLGEVLTELVPHRITILLYVSVNNGNVAETCSWKRIERKIIMSRHMTKPTKWPVHLVKTKISPGICPVRSVFAVRMKKPRVIRVFAGHIDHFVMQRLRERARQNQQKDMCTQRKLGSAWTSAQSDQSSVCALQVDKDTTLIHADSEDFDQKADQSLCWVYRSFAVHLLRPILFTYSLNEEIKLSKPKCSISIPQASLNGVSKTPIKKKTGFKTSSMHFI